MRLLMSLLDLNVREVDHPVINVAAPEFAELHFHL